jgi:hypothetical protein
MQHCCSAGGHMVVVANHHAVLLSDATFVILTTLCTLWSMPGQKISGWSAGLLLQSAQAGRSSSSS